MHIEDLYEFTTEPTMATFSPWLDKNIYVGKVRWSLEYQLIRGEYTGLEFPIVFRHYPDSCGKKFRDVLDVGGLDPFLISDRLKGLLETHGFTGWKTYPIVIWDRKNNQVSGYHGFSVTGRCGKIDWSRAEIAAREYTFDKYHKGVPIDLNTWDGSDFFVPVEGYSLTVITKRVQEVLKAHKISNLELRKLTEQIRDIKYAIPRHTKRTLLLDGIELTEAHLDPRREMPQRSPRALLREQIERIEDPSQRRRAHDLVERLHQQSVRAGIEQEKARRLRCVIQGMIEGGETLEKIQKYTGRRMRREGYKRDMKDFYTFESKSLPTTFVASLCVSEQDFAPSQARKLLLADHVDLEWPVTYRHVLGKGSKLKDLLQTDHAGLYLISERLRSILETHKLSGWETYPVGLWDAKGQEVQGYHGFSITGRCGAVDYDASVIATRGSVFEELHVDLYTWDGSDFFVPEHHEGIVISERAVQVLKESKVSNTRFTNLLKVKTPIEYIIARMAHPRKKAAQIQVELAAVFQAISDPAERRKAIMYANHLENESYKAERDGFITRKEMSRFDPPILEITRDVLENIALAMFKDNQPVEKVRRYIDGPYMRISLADVERLRDRVS